MGQDEQARRPFSPDLELVAAPGPPALIQLLVRDTLVIEVLLDEDGGGLDILPRMLYAEGVVACREGKKERCASSREGIEHPQALCKLPAVGARENGNVEQYACKDFVGLAFVTAYLDHLQRDERGKVWLQWAQDWPFYPANVREIFVRRARCTQAGENRKHAWYCCVFEVYEQVSLACERYRLDMVNGSAQWAGEEFGRRQGRCHVAVLSAALRRDGECEFHVGEYSILSLVRVDLTCLVFVLTACLARVFLVGVQESVQAYLPLGPGGCPSCPGGCPSCPGGCPSCPGGYPSCPNECPLGPGGYPSCPNECPLGPGGYPLGPGGYPSCPGECLLAQSADPLHQSVSPLYRSVLTAA